MIPQTPDIMQSPLCYEGDKRNIPADTPLGTNQLSYKQGFPPITSIDVDAGGIAPERKDMNAALNLLSIHTYFLQSGNKYKYSNLLDYEIGSTVLGSDNALYYCIQANGATEPNTVQDPTSSTGYWVELINSAGQLNVDLIPNSAITGEKIANATITAAQIAANAITNEKIANGAVNDTKISGVAAGKVSGLARVATSGSYNDLSNKPTIPTNFPPRPIKGTGTALGVWRLQIFASSQPATIPSGGTWAWFIASILNHTITGFDAGVDSGGTTVLDFPSDKYTLLWRIQ